LIYRPVPSCQVDSVTRTLLDLPGEGKQRTRGLASHILYGAVQDVTRPL
jgi:hypothetical protein